MTKQNSPYFWNENRNMYHWGCYIFSLAYSADYIEEDPDIFNKLYIKALGLGLIKTNCFVLDAQGLLRLLIPDKKVTFIGRSKYGKDTMIGKWKSTDANVRIQHTKTPNGYHFTYEQSNGEILDPYYPSPTQTVIGYRYFNVQ